MVEPQIFLQASCRITLPWVSQGLDQVSQFLEMVCSSFGTLEKFFLKFAKTGSSVFHTRPGFCDLWFLQRWLSSPDSNSIIFGVRLNGFCLFLQNSLRLNSEPGWGCIVLHSWDPIFTMKTGASGCIPSDKIFTMLWCFSPFFAC